MELLVIAIVVAAYTLRTEIESSQGESQDCAPANR